MLDALASRFDEARPREHYSTLRYVRSRTENVSVRQGVLEPVAIDDDAGVMVTVLAGGGYGYGATTDLSVSGLARAFAKAREWAERTAASSVFDFGPLAGGAPRGEYESIVERPWADVSLADKVELLTRECGRLKRSERIVDWSARLWHTETESLFLTSEGGRVHQRLSQLAPGLMAVANRGDMTQRRTLGDVARQGGLEVLGAVGFFDQAERIAEQALELLDAPNCPAGEMDLLLAPDQMYLQIHESIGHPLELDRILGDERNYAGTSFVTTDMIGSYRYGSELLNVTYDPTLPSEFASYGFDDEGAEAKRAHIIEGGILKRALGGTTSQARSGQAGVACGRASSWSRPPIDRMANLNVEPGTSSLEDMLTAVERGVYMETNCSWSIDDSRNKFQFGCEYARLIEDGALGAVVRNPCYRGISATFWRNLKMVGEPSLFKLHGTPQCGKGEPNQAVFVGHASPTCLFENVAVFGGA